MRSRRWRSNSSARFHLRNVRSSPVSRRMARRGFPAAKTLSGMSLVATVSYVGSRPNIQSAGHFLGRRAIAKIYDAAVEALLFQKMQLTANAVRQCRFAAGYHYGHDEKPIFVDQTGLFRMRGKIRTSD